MCVTEKIAISHYIYTRVYIGGIIIIIIIIIRSVAGRVGIPSQHRDVGSIAITLAYQLPCCC